MHLVKYTVRGFRSLADVADIPVGKPTILAGPNDGGKSSALDALAFLLDEHTCTDDDRSHWVDDAEVAAKIEVIGHFALDAWEQERFGLPSEARIRRVCDPARVSGWDLWSGLPVDEDLRDLSGTVPQLWALVKRYDLRPTGVNRPQLLAALLKYRDESSAEQGWTPLPPDLRKRLPVLSKFNGTTPGRAVEETLKPLLTTHLAEPDVVARLDEVRTTAGMWLRDQSKSLGDHIVARIPDVAEVTIEPDVEVKPRLRGVTLTLRRGTGESVRLDRAGQGRNRRIAMAVWEANNELLRSAAGTAGDATPRQVLVIYDEPDTHLDFHHQREIMRLIREQGALSHVSVIVATHAMNLIDGVDIQDVVLLRLDGNDRTVIEQLGTRDHDDFDRHLGLIAKAVGLRNSVLLHERCFLAVEGATEKKVIPLLFQLSEGLSLQAAGVALWACDNNDGALRLAAYLVKHKRSVMLMIDHDTPELSKVFKEENLKRHFDNRTEEFVVRLGQTKDARELEALFGDETWAATANSAWPRGDGTPWTAAHFRAKRGKKFSTDVLNMVKEGASVAPSGKPDMLFEVVARLDEPSAVPEELRNAFSRLRALAG